MSLPASAPISAPPEAVPAEEVSTPAAQSRTPPFITIGVASYNYGPRLEKAFEAVRGQTFTDWELLYCDDGSTDESVPLIEGFIAAHPELRIRLVRGGNGGIMTNKNRILDHARGAYLMLCDADDWMDSGCLSTLGGAARASGADRIVSSAKETDEAGRVLDTFPISSPPSKWAYFVHHGVLYKREVIEEHHLRFSENCYPDDFYFAQWFNLYAKKTEFLEGHWYNRLVHASSTSAASIAHPDSPWYCVPVLGNMLDHSRNLLSRLEDEKDRQELELVAITRYYDILYNLRVVTFPEIHKTYKVIRAMMRKAFPGYLKSHYVWRMSAAPVSRQRKWLLFVCIWSEKLRLMPLAISGYWALAHLGVAQSIFGIQMKNHQS